MQLAKPDPIPHPFTHLSPFIRYVMKTRISISILLPFLGLVNSPIEAMAGEVSESEPYKLSAQLQKEGVRPDVIYEILKVDCPLCVPIGIEIHKSGLVVRYGSEPSAGQSMCVMKSAVAQALKEIRASMSSGLLQKECKKWVIWSTGLSP